MPKLVGHFENHDDLAKAKNMAPVRESEIIGSVDYLTEDPLCSWATLSGCVRRLAIYTLPSPYIQASTYHREMKEGVEMGSI
jgi:hypothetical protein